MKRDDPPMVRSIPPKGNAPAAGLLPIVPDAAPKGRVAGKEVSVEKYWLDFYRTHDDHTINPKTKAIQQTAAEGLREKVALLNVNKKFRVVRAVLVGFLTYHSKEAEPWMYEALALSIKMNKGSDADIKTALGFAADMATKSRNPNHLVSVADQLMLMGATERAGALLDQAAALVPHRAEPLMMSINLAQKTRDPGRMAAAVDALLSLGWPGYDDGMRRDARKQVETLAKALREDALGTEADALLAQLRESEARDVFVRVNWLGDADLDLVVEEPLGATARVSSPRTVFGGSIVKNGLGSHPEEVYVCPRAFDGEYIIRVDPIANDEKKPTLAATVEIITHEGTAEEHKETHTVTLPNSGKPSEPLKFVVKGGRRKRALPFLAPTVVTPTPPARVEAPSAKGEARNAPAPKR